MFYTHLHILLLQLMLRDIAELQCPVLDLRLQYSKSKRIEANKLETWWMVFNMVVSRIRIWTSSHAYVEVYVVSICTAPRKMQTSQ
jgi:hypothetical protein